METEQKFSKKKMNAYASDKESAAYRNSRRIPYGKSKQVPLTIADLEMTLVGKKAHGSD